MTERHAAISGIEWREEDVRKMDSIPSGSIDVAFDKGTLDAMIHGSPWSPPDDVKENTSLYLREVYAPCSLSLTSHFPLPIFTRRGGPGLI